MNTIKFAAVAYSYKGKIRANNEDNFYFNGIHLNEKNRDEKNHYSDKHSGADLIYGVFDGMGGEALGEEASLIAAETLKKYHNRINKHQSANDDKTILRTVDEANSKICDKMVETGERRIGTTFAAISIKDDKAKIYNVGDSRVYLFRNKKLKQISIDDTTAQRLINMGVLTKEKAKTHEDRHKLTQHLGIYKDEMIVEPHISSEIDIQKGDCFLLCSDGLTDMVEDDVISDIIKKSKNCDIAGRKLVEEALVNGGRDNVTLIMISAESASAVKKKINKKRVVISCVLTAVIALLGVVGIGVMRRSDEIYTDTNQEIVATELKWANPMEEVTVGATGTLMVQKEPANANGDIIWNTSNSEVMTISDKGVYTAHSVGDVEITAQLNDVKCTMKLTVVDTIENIVVEHTNIRMKIGEKTKIRYSIIPETSKQKVTFMTDDTEVLSIDENCVVTAIGEGRATVNISSGQINKIVIIDVAGESKKPVLNEGKSREKAKNDIQENDNENKDNSEEKSDTAQARVNDFETENKTENNQKRKASDSDDIAGKFQ